MQHISREIITIINFDPKADRAEGRRHANLATLHPQCFSG